MADPAGGAGDEPRFRSIEMLGDLVGRYCWVEHRIFEMAGTWASAPPGDGGSPSTGLLSQDGSLDAADAERRVWCAAASRRHGALSARWRDRLPLRAGVDRAALVAPPAGPLLALLEELADADPRDGLHGLVRGVLPGLAETYAAHLMSASAVSEGPVMEVLVEARREGLRDIRGGLLVLQDLPRTANRDGFGAPKWAGEVDQVVERAFDQFGVFPAVRRS